MKTIMLRAPSARATSCNCAAKRCRKLVFASRSATRVLLATPASNVVGLTPNAVRPRRSVLASGSALTLASTLRRGLTAFGVSPTTLLAGVAKSTRVADLEAKTSFRQRFAAQLHDVARALGARSMIVFIDDLDRCRPEQMVDLLEAVNFVVSSGDVYVVLGMAPSRVEPCIAL